MSPTGEMSGEAHSQFSWSLEVRFVQVPDEKRDVYWAALRWVVEKAMDVHLAELVVKASEP